MVNAPTVRARISGYRNGASGDELANSTSAPTINNTRISGTNHHFFSCLMNSQNSLASDCFAIISHLLSK